jgi:hypothetical protein
MRVSEAEIAIETATTWETEGDRSLSERSYASALECYRRALAIEPARQSSRRRLAALLVELGHTPESLPLWHAELAASGDGLVWLQQLVTEKIERRDLHQAGELASISAAVRRASPWYPAIGDAVLAKPVQVPQAFLSVGKLRHDIRQLRYLQRCNLLGPEFESIIACHERLLEEMRKRPPDARVPLEGEAHEMIGEVYGRIIHLRPTARVKRALSDRWDARAVERAYLERPPGVVVIDDFLTTEALQAVREFALQSTVWFANRYAFGRLGAFFHEGFSCPLLVQIAEEIRDAFPCVIGDRYPLRQLWAFKNSEDLPPEATVHADFAAVNVNFWITPESANLDPHSGGMTIFGVDAPSHWDFETYNGRTDIIKPFLQRQGADSMTVPYRQNRAMIFNSDLFHTTDEVRFRPEYENHRINVTMLYGERADDSHHRTVSPEHPNASMAWRSAVFRRKSFGSR